ncbi:beta-ketoacyl-[acyl-carrier-protein] synthase family protein [Pyrinomonas methylaliphatogenes]|jgi:3-oxoacyl-[acyl-carrier-protein] synthase II|uniref:3-oxoacyl-(Acyl-carrier-protein) synthase n=1 Tax=Pyrinomonas methylaliphatogenes TaxID=454194 RepID=A0A0B6WSF4_9BACT|nr:beta-ketoacyl-[acyl-carrier-protein] synthase family protein [Pyrinomonas methylaliphatogenes]CDM64138.1 3-oxoacyl-(acyl-carrier-protein) synthase [Pyrinomonas methylaliphatogenes]
MRATDRQIVITGYGAISALGNDVDSLWRSLLEARSGVAPISAFPTGDFRPNYAAEAREFSPEALDLAPRKLKLMGRHAQFALAAAREAGRTARLIGGEPFYPPSRLGVVLGTGMLNADVADLGRAFAATAQERRGEKMRFDLAAFSRYGVPQLFPLWLLRHIPNMTSAHASIALNLQGPANTIMNGCVASLAAIGEARRLIARGEASAVFAGGTDARISPLALLRYRDLGWLATRDDVPPIAVSAPFDAHAAGFVCGEGAGALLLEDEEAARQRNAPIRAAIIGYGAANEAGDPLHPSPEGRALARAITICLRRSGLAPDEIDAIFAPAISVPDFDRATACALSTVFARCRPFVTATRSLLGHAHAASGAFDLIAAVKALEAGQLPPTINLERPIADFAFVTEGARAARLDHVLIAGYGFGGHAAALILRRVDR